MKLISKQESSFDAEYIYEYKGYIVKESYSSEDDCNHHSTRVLKDNVEIISFNWNGCLEKAKNYIDENTIY